MRLLVPVALFLVSCSGSSERVDSGVAESCSIVINDNGVCQVEFGDDGVPLDEDGTCPLSCE